MSFVEGSSVVQLRDALKSLLDRMDDFGINEEIVLISHENKVLMESMHTDQTLEVLRKAKSALSAPLKNCDLYNTKDEAKMAWARQMYRDRTTDLKYGDWLFAKVKGETKCIQ